MIANIATAVLGIWLVYSAVLNPALMGSPFKIVAIAAGAILIVLAAIARRTDYHSWHSSVTRFLGVVLFGIGCWNVVAATPAIVNYWTTFWVGVLAAFVALWAALYRPTLKPS